MKFRFFSAVMIMVILIALPITGVAEETRIQKDTGRVSLDVPVISAPKSMKSYSAEYAEYDVKAIRNAFVGENVCNENIVPVSSENEYAIYNYASEQATIDITDRLYVDYETNQIKFTSQLLSPLESYPENELGFMSRQAAMELCLNTIQPIFGECMVDKVYSLDADTLQFISDSERSELQMWADLGKEIWLQDDWSEDDECYYLKLKFLIDGTPYTSTSYTEQIAGTSYSGCEIYVIVTKNGIEYFKLYNIPNIVETYETQTILSQHEIINIYADSVNKTLGDKQKYIDNMRFELIPVYESGYNFMERFRVVPAWVLEYKFVVNGAEGELVGHKDIIINAFTGEKIG